MDDLSGRLALTYAAVGGVALLLALVSRRVRAWPVSEPLAALVVGVVLGPEVLGLVRLAAGTADTLLLEGTRVLLAASVMAAALRFQATDLRDVRRAVALLLLVAMPVAAVLSGAVALVAGLPLALALVVGCCLSPTDPVLAASVVTGDAAERALPGRLRRMLTVESGANDGLALPLVGLAVAVAVPTGTVGAALPRVLVEVVGAVAVGLLLGGATAGALSASRRAADLEPGPELVLTLLLALATLGVARSLHVGGVLAVFVAGLAYNVVLGRSARDEGAERRDRASQDRVDEAVNRYAVLPVFVLLGVLAPWSGWAALGPGGLVLVAGTLLLRRPPVLVALARPLGLRVREGAFAGWFGPMGVSALFYLAHVRHEGVSDPRVFAAVTLAVTASVVASGLSASPLRELYRRTSA